MKRVRNLSIQQSTYVLLSYSDGENVLNPTMYNKTYLMIKMINNMYVFSIEGVHVLKASRLGNVQFLATTQHATG